MREPLPYREESVQSISLYREISVFLSATHPPWGSFSGQGHSIKKTIWRGSDKRHRMPDNTLSPAGAGLEFMEQTKYRNLKRSDQEKGLARPSA